MISPKDYLTIALWFIGTGSTAVFPEEITKDLPEAEFNSRMRGFVDRADNYPLTYVAAPTPEATQTPATPTTTTN